MRYGFNRCLLTSSCTDALEMAAILAGIGDGDEVIMPSYTFVSTANAFILRGSRVIFADSRKEFPGIDEAGIEELITPRTRIIIPVHYAGISCDMDIIMGIAEKYNLMVIEDAAQAIDSYYKGRPLGSIGNMGCFSFHETKNIISGEGGMLTINDKHFISRAEIIWEKGTNRAEFFRGEINKYGWVDIGSSFLPSEITAAFLAAQIENIDRIQKKRTLIFNYYYQALKPLEQKYGIRLPFIPEYATINGHMFYIVCNSLKERNGLIKFLGARNIHAVFHYLPLHSSEYYARFNIHRDLPNADMYSECLLRLPFFYELTDKELLYITDAITGYYESL